jgi:hypothetical protein
LACGPARGLVRVRIRVRRRAVLGFTSVHGQLSGGACGSFRRSALASKAFEVDDG